MKEADLLHASSPTMELSVTSSCPLKKAKVEPLKSKFNETSEGYECKVCKKVLSSKSSHKTLKYHVEKVHFKPPSMRSLAELGFKKKTPSSSLKQRIVAFIVNGGHPFTIVEEPAFKDLVHFICKQTMETILPVASTVTEWTFFEYEESKKKIIRRLGEVSGDIALTTDIWTSSAQKSFMVITAHFVEKSILDSLVLDFSFIASPHTAPLLRHRVEEIAASYGILEKMSTITTDNASNNNGFDQFRDLSETSRVRCMAHVLHLAVMAGIKSKKDPQIQRLRDVIIFIKNSLKQLEKMESQAKAFKIDFVRPIRDVPTRWNSTVDMIRRAIHLEPLICNLLRFDKDYSDYSILPEDWKLYRALEVVLEPYERGFYRALNIQPTRW